VTDLGLAELTGPGGRFEIVVEDVAGCATRVYGRRMRSLGALMEQNARRADVDWLVQGERRFTFGEHDRLARLLARSLAGLGVGRGDRVALCSANSPEWIITWWACALLGAIVVPLNAWWKTEELRFGLEDSGSVVLIADDRRIGPLRDRVREIRGLRHVFATDGPVGDGIGAFDELIAGADDPGFPELVVGEDDVLAIFYTSGTTGEPKGATVTHRQVIANLQNVSVMGALSAARGAARPEADAGLQPATLLVVPLFHITGCLSSMMLSYATGARVVLMPPGRFDPDVAMQIIEREQVTSIGGVPTVMWQILESPNRDRYNLSSVKRASYGGAPAPPELVDRIGKVFPGLRQTLTTGYGLTEAGLVTQLGGDDYFAHPGSVGRVLPTIELRIVSDAGADAPTGLPGEVWVRGPTVMAHGYWHRPDANQAAFTDGWFHTGDIGRVDEQGFLYLVDRAKDMIIRAGENVYCVEIEHVLFDHPDVIDAAVIGVPHKTLGEEVKAVVQLRPTTATSAEDLQVFCRDRLADFKVPAHVEIRSEPLPRNPAGKVLKQLLRENATIAISDDQPI
jgi:long-chain acyl-CoA synthetase